MRSRPALAVTRLARLSETARLLIACRAARSVGQGALVVDFALYLHALGWTGLEMGLVYTGGLLAGAVLTLLSGPFSDRVGRKPFLVAYSVVQVLAALAALWSGRLEWLVPAAVAGAYGRGANGAAGPFGPVEQAWLSADLGHEDFGWALSFNSAVGYTGMALGAGLAGLPALGGHALPGALAYRPLFLLALAGGVVPLALLARMRDVRGPLTARGGPRERPARTDPRGEGGLLARLMGINVLNGLAIGMIGPFMAYWFLLRFGAGPAAIAPVMAAGFLLASASALWTGWLTRRLGTVRAVVVMRLAGLVLLVLLPLAPSYPLAAVCYTLRAACNRGTSGARQAVGLALVGPGRRGLAASLNSASLQIPRGFGPVIGGWLLDADYLLLPLLLAAALQAAYLALYEVTFRDIV
ncbi:MAG TPA: MFS transporter [Acetobacteraceae bacterium]|nr:MFS transporter [Acetobacteraceae bacterium]